MMENIHIQSVYTFGSEQLNNGTQRYHELKIQSESSFVVYSKHTERKRYLKFNTRVQMKTIERSSWI